MAQKVFMVGAGFTRSFTAQAPLMIDFLDKAEKRGSLDKTARHSALFSVVETYFGTDLTRVNIEEVATFLLEASDDWFARFFDKRAAYEQLIEIVMLVLGNIGTSKTLKDNEPNYNAFKKIADQCISDNVAVLSFNYDLLMDNLLKDTQGWEPVYGYGQQMRTVAKELGTLVKKREQATVLLKLHGSLNWGQRHVPYSDGTMPIELNTFGVDVVPHGPGFPIMPIKNTVAAQGGPFTANYYYDPFIIPPLSDKSGHYSHPFVRETWFLAGEALKSATEITVLGYSFPSGDFRTRNLFRESINSPLAEAPLLVRIVDPNYEHVRDVISSLINGRRSVTFEHLSGDVATWASTI